MKRKRKQFIAVILSSMMIFSTTGFAFADVDLDNPPSEPTKPKVENYQDNNKIKDYNEKAKDYNKKADEYNAAVDKEYNDAVEEVNKKNAEGQQKQADSQKAHDDAIATNEAEQARVDEANKKIDEENAVEEERVKQENEKRQEQYNNDYAQYLKDKDLEQQIYDAGYESIEAYNQVVTNYNNKVQKYNEQVTTLNEYYVNEIQKCIDLTAASAGQGIETVTNDESKLPDAYNVSPDLPLTTNPKTIKIEPAAEPSGETYRIMVQHIYRDGDLFVGKWEIIEADLNDTVTIVSEKAVMTPNDKGSILTYNYTDESHADGYWIPSIYFASSARPQTDLSVPGDTYQGPIYQFSYSNGSVNNSSGDEKDITLVYDYTYGDYSWYTPYQLREYFDYANVPNKPTLDLETFNPKEYEIPNFIVVPDVETWENLPDPIKREYLKRLALMSLFNVPKNNNDNNNNNETIVYYGMGDGTVSTPEPTHTVLPTTKTPFTAPAETGAWAFINLLAVLANFVVCIFLLLMVFINNRKEDDETEVKNRMLGRICTLIIAIVSGIIFLFTEDMSLPMVWVDQWTVLMICTFVLQLIVGFLSRHKEEEIEQEHE